MTEVSKALDRTFLAIAGKLKRAVAGIVPPKEVEDIVQEAYVRACQANQQSTIRAPRAFLFKTVRNLALDHVKRAETRLLDPLSAEETGLPDSLIDGRDPLGEVATHEEFSLFCEAVRLLPARCRRAFVLKKVYGYSRREIAKHMAVSENTVQTLIARGMKACVQFMERVESEHRDHNVIELSASRPLAKRATQDDRR